MCMQNYIVNNLSMQVTNKHYSVSSGQLSNQISKEHTRKLREQQILHSSDISRGVQIIT
jgi:hypothetical protein